MQPRWLSTLVAAWANARAGQPQQLQTRQQLETGEKERKTSGLQKPYLIVVRYSLLRRFVYIMLHRQGTTGPVWGYCSCLDQDRCPEYYENKCSSCCNQDGEICRISNQVRQLGVELKVRLMHICPLLLRKHRPFDNKRNTRASQSLSSNLLLRPTR